MRAAGELESGCRGRVEAVRVDHVQAPPRFAGRKGVARPAGRVTCRQARRHGEGTDVEDLAVFEGTGARPGRKREQDAVLGIVRAGLPLPQDGSGPLAGQHPGPAQPRKLRDAAGVIEVRVRHEDELHVLDPEAQRANALDNLRGRLGQVAVDEDMALAGGEERRAQAAHADVVGVPEDPERLLGLVEGRARLARRRRRVGPGRTLEHQKAEQGGESKHGGRTVSQPGPLLPAGSGRETGT